MPAPNEFDFSLLDGHALTPEQRDAIKQYAVWRANAERVRLIRAAGRRLLSCPQLLAAFVRELASGWWKSFAAARARSKAFAELQSLDDRDLKDMGISRGEIMSFVDQNYRDPTRVPRGGEMRMPRAVILHLDRKPNAASAQTPNGGKPLAA